MRLTQNRLPRRRRLKHRQPRRPPPRRAERGRLLPAGDQLRQAGARRLEVQPPRAVVQRLRAVVLKLAVRVAPKVAPVVRLLPAGETHQGRGP